MPEQNNTQNEILENSIFKNNIKRVYTQAENNEAVFNMMNIMSIADIYKGYVSDVKSKDRLIKYFKVYNAIVEAASTGVEIPYNYKQIAPYIITKPILKLMVDACNRVEIKSEILNNYRRCGFLINENSFKARVEYIQEKANKVGVLPSEAVISIDNLTQLYETKQEPEVLKFNENNTELSDSDLDKILNDEDDLDDPEDIDKTDEEGEDTDEDDDDDLEKFAQEMNEQANMMEAEEKTQLEKAEEVQEAAEQEAEKQAKEEAEKQAKEEEQKAKEEEAQKNGEKSEKEIDEAIAAMRKSYKIDVKAVINSICITLNKLYLSGYEAMPLSGLLLNQANGIPDLCRVPTASQRQANPDIQVACVEDCGYTLDKRLMKALLQFPGFENLSNISADPEVSLKSVKGGSVKTFYMFHLAMLSGNIDFTAHHHYSVRKFATRNGLDIENKEQFDTVHIKNKKIAQKYIRDSVEYVLYKALYDAGINDKNAEEKDTEIRQIAAMIDATLKNVVVVAERKKNDDGTELVSTRLKIASATSVDIEALVKFIEAQLNGGNSAGIIKVNTFGQNDSNVVNLEVVYDEKQANKADPFAYELMDSIKGSGLSWGHVLMGKRDDGDYFFWDDFMGSAEPYKRAYTIYAGSRSGKGIMTSTLVASAIASGVNLRYTDGKPENGVVIGDIAWSAGKEAYVFDGKPVGNAPFAGDMANYTSGIRKPDEFKVDTPSVPSFFSSSDEALNNFFGIMRYLRSICLCYKTIDYRSINGCNGPDGKPTWDLWIFDEMSNMAKIEASVNIFIGKWINSKWDKTWLEKKQALDTSKYLAAIKKGPKDGITQQDIDNLKWVNQWCEWKSSITSLASTAQTISLGKSNTNIIFIFQEATWLKTDTNTDYSKGDSTTALTTLAKLALMSKTTKIIGKNAIADQCKDYGDGITKQNDWYDTIQNGQTMWGISSTASVAGRNVHVDIFKPYKVWTVPLKGDNMDMQKLNEFKQGKSKESLRYFRGYITELIGHSPVEEISKAYYDSEWLVKKLGLATDLKSYIYDCHSFEREAEESATEKALREYEAGQNGEVPEGETPIGNGNNESGSSSNEDNGAFSTVKDIDFGNTPAGEKSTGEQMWSGDANTDFKKAMDLAKNASDIPQSVQQTVATQPTQNNNQVFENPNQQSQPQQQQAQNNNQAFGTPSQQAQQQQQAFDNNQASNISNLFNQLLEATNGMSHDKMSQMFNMLGCENSDELADVFDNMAHTQEQAPMPVQEAPRTFTAPVNPEEYQQVIDTANMDSHDNANMIKLADRNSFGIVEMFTSARRKRAKKNFESSTGTSYELHERLQIIIRSALKANNNDKFLIKSMKIEANNIYFNNKRLMCDSLLTDGVTIYDIINYKELFETLDQFVNIYLDSEAFKEFGFCYYEDDALKNLFIQLPRLRVFMITLPNGAERKFLRTDLGKELRELQKQTSIAKLKGDIDSVAAVKNPRFNKKSAAEKQKHYDRLMQAKDANWKGYLEEVQQKDRSFFKMATHGAYRHAKNLTLGLRIKRAAKGLGNDFKR